MTLREIVEQLEACGFECEAGPLENNVAFQELKEQAAAQEWTPFPEPKSSPLEVLLTLNKTFENFSYASLPVFPHTEDIVTVAPKETYRPSLLSSWPFRPLMPPRPKLGFFDGMTHEEVAEKINANLRANGFTFPASASFRSEGMYQVPPITQEDLEAVRSAAESVGELPHATLEFVKDRQAELMAAALERDKEANPMLCGRFAGLPKITLDIEEGPREVPESLPRWDGWSNESAALVAFGLPAATFETEEVPTVACRWCGNETKSDALKCGICRRENFTG